MNVHCDRLLEEPDGVNRWSPVHTRTTSLSAQVLPEVSDVLGLDGLSIESRIERIPSTMASFPRDVVEFSLIDRSMAVCSTTVLAYVLFGLSALTLF